MRIPNWRSRKTPLARMGAAAFILAAVVPLQHSGTTSASASHVTVINVRPATTIDYVGTVDPAQLSTARTGAALAGTAREARHVVPFLTPHRASTRQQVASGAVPRLAAATISVASTDASNLISRSPVGGISLGGFPSLSAADHFATHGYDLEPPDNAICAGPHQQIFQLINNVAAVYSARGAIQLGPISNEAFFQEPGPYSLSDPRCVYDPAAQAFYAEEWANTYDANFNVTAARLDLAVNLSGDPTKPWSLFRIDVSDAAISGCPCLPDYTMIGFDQHGIYLSSNQFSSDLSTYVGDRISVIGKGALLNFLRHPATTPRPTVFAYSLPNDFTVQPAVSYDPVSRTEAQREYFVESLDIQQNGGYGSNQLAVFAFSQEGNLDSGAAPGTLLSTPVTTEGYAMPLTFTGNGLAAVQKGYYGAVTLNDDRVLQVVNAGGGLWATLTTALAFTSLDTQYVRAGAAWFKLSPALSSTGLSASVAAQGYVAAPFTYFSYPALAINAQGHAAMVLTTFPADPRFPGTGSAYPEVVVATGSRSSNGTYMPFSAARLVATSSMADIGFTTVLYPPQDEGGTPDYLSGGGRWGDYSAATIDPTYGLFVYLNTEWIPGPAAEGSVANWGTFMARYLP